MAGDGTALWLTVLVPGSARIDVRARQAAFLMVRAAGGAAQRGADVVIGRDGGVAARGGRRPGGAGRRRGVGVLLGVVMVVPGTDAHQRSGNPLSIGDNDSEAMGQVLAGLVLIVATVVPAGGAAALLGWWGALVGLVTGVLAWWGLAAARLERRGPELLTLLRHGRGAASSGARPSFEVRLATLPPRSARTWRS